MSAGAHRSSSRWASPRPDANFRISPRPVRGESRFIGPGRAPAARPEGIHRTRAPAARAEHNDPELPITIAIISDTHMPRGERRLPDRCVELLTAADLIIHAGDFTALSVLTHLQSLNTPIKAVHGNVDAPELRHALPETRTVTLETGHALAIVHDAGPARGRIDRLEARFEDADAVIFGHSHMPLHERAPDGFQIFNPGSPTERRRAPTRTMGIARATAAELRFELVDLG